MDANGGVVPAKPGDWVESVLWGVAGAAAYSQAAGSAAVTVGLSALTLYAGMRAYRPNTLSRSVQPLLVGILAAGATCLAYRVTQAQTSIGRECWRQAQDKMG